MSRASGTAPGTEEHRAPELGPSGTAAPALLVAFPRPLVLDVPPSGVALGRDWLASSGVSDTRVSGEHLRFTKSGGGFWVEDTGSRNGTWLDGHRLTPGEQARLADGSILRMGRLLLLFRPVVRAAVVQATHPTCIRCAPLHRGTNCHSDFTAQEGAKTPLDHDSRRIRAACSRVAAHGLVCAPRPAPGAVAKDDRRCTHEFW